MFEVDALAVRITDGDHAGQTGTVIATKGFTKSLVVLADGTEVTLPVSTLQEA